jgi:cellulose synthase/poly-beta-1,6-N-acetylglucosamine synthase-like glycosyltransferase
MQAFKVICIDADNRPKRISPYEWLTEGQTYTVVEVARMSLQQNRFGYRLKEVQLSDQSFPFEYYSAERFIAIEHLEQVAEEQTQEADLEQV